MIIEIKNRKFLVDEETPIKGGDFFISIYGDNTYRINKCKEWVNAAGIPVCADWNGYLNPLTRGNVYYKLIKEIDHKECKRGDLVFYSGPILNEFVYDLPCAVVETLHGMYQIKDEYGHIYKVDNFLISELCLYK